MSLKSLRRSRAAFTLIELLVVVLILAILMAIALPMYLNSIADANKRACQTNMKQIATALQAYRTRVSDHKYPATLSLLVTPPTGYGLAELSALPHCPEAPTTDYTYADAGSGIGPITITCPADTTHGSWANGALTIP